MLKYRPYVIFSKSFVIDLILKKYIKDIILMYLKLKTVRDFKKFQEIKNKTKKHGTTVHILHFDSILDILLFYQYLNYVTHKKNAFTNK